MKHLIILQNSTVFTVDIEKIAQPNLNLYLIVNPKSYEHLVNRNQEKLFSFIKIQNDFSYESLIRIIEPILKEIKNDDVILSTNSENLIRVSGRLREYFNINGANEHTTRAFSDKDYMKQILSKFDVPFPKYITFDHTQFERHRDKYLQSIIKYLNFPMIAKPIDGVGCSGVQTIADAVQLKDWAACCDKNQLYEIDEFIIGELYHCDSFIADGAILYTQVCRYSHPPHTFMLGKNVGSITLPSDHADFISLKRFNDTILRHLSSNISGVTHLEAFKKNNGELVFLEVAYRGGGAGIPKVYQQHLGLDLFSMHFLLQLHNRDPFVLSMGQPSAWIQFTSSSKVMNLDDLPITESNVDLIKKNNQISSNEHCISLRDYSLQILLWHENFNQLSNDFALLTQI